MVVAVAANFNACLLSLLDRLCTCLLKLKIMSFFLYKYMYTFLLTQKVPAIIKLKEITLKRLH